MLINNPKDIFIQDLLNLEHDTNFKKNAKITCQWQQDTYKI